MDEQQQTKTLFGPRVKAALPKFGKFMAEATPIIGDAIAAEEVYKELQKDEPNYFLAGALGGAAIVGLVPGLGDAAASAIRAGARKALDTAKRVEVDPTALGSMGGNIRLKPKENIWSYPEQLYDSAETSINVSKKPAGYNELKKRGEIKDNELIVDIGGGKFDNLVEDAAKEGATVKVYDPFNRTPEHNAAVVNEIKDGQADMAMSHNVLNVIQEDKNIINIARQAENAIKPNGKAHFSVYEGTGTGVGKVTTKGYQRNEKTKNYVPLIENVFGKGNVIRKGKIITATKSINNFNKGGTVMNRQMEMAFMQQGGLKDDGMKVDPVSGNEIPPGSLAKEVRDDIPAQLSEGEYVVPADVVQYYGVKHFEDLRDKAKGGLQQMERDGRIGGEPVPAGGPKAGPAGQMMKQQPPPMPPKPPVTSGMTQAPMPPAPKQMAMGGPLTAEEMQEIRKMANGGMVQMADPYQQQKAMYQQPQGMADGGFSFYQPSEPEVTIANVTSPGPAPGFGQYTGEFSFEPVGAGSVTQRQVKLYGPNGEVKTLMLPKEQNEYNRLLGLGYTETPPSIVSPQPSREGRDVGFTAPSPDPTAWMDKFTYDPNKTKDLVTQTKNTMSDSKLPSILSGGALGIFDKGSRYAQAAANIIILKAQGVDQNIIDGLKTEWNKGKPSLPNFTINGDQLAIQASIENGIKLERNSTDIFGKNLFSSDKSYEKYTKNYTDKNPKTVTPTKTEKETLAPKDDKYGGVKVEDSAFARRFNPSAIGKLKSEVEKDNLASAIGVSRDQYDKMSEYERSERLAGNAKGGLMKRKK